MAHRKNGLTLIELLVVIGILVIFIAILLPATGGRRPAQRGACMANLKSIGLAAMMYSVENDNFFPLQPINNAQGGADFYNEAAGQHPNVWASCMTYAGKNPKVFICPVALPSTGSASGAITPASDTNYMFNGVAAGNAMTRIKDPAHFILIHENRWRTSTCFLRPYADSAGSFVFWSARDAADDAQSAFDDLHGSGTSLRGGNQAYADGHVESKKLAELHAGDFGLVPGGVNPGLPADTWDTAAGPKNAWSKTYGSGLVAPPHP